MNASVKLTTADLIGALQSLAQPSEAELARRRKLISDVMLGMDPEEDADEYPEPRQWPRVGPHPSRLR